MGTDFIPNAYQTPNAWVDKLMYLLSPEEWKVLSYFARRILGFNKRADRLSYSQVMDGYSNKDGVRLDHGTGLGLGAVTRAIKTLTGYGLLTLDTESAGDNRGPLYSIQMDSDLVDLPGLIRRRQEKEQRERERMYKARLGIQPRELSNNEEETPLYSIVGGQTPLYSTDGDPHYPLEGDPPLMDNIHNRQGYTVDKQNKNNGSISPQPEEPAGAGAEPATAGAEPAKPKPKRSRSKVTVPLDQLRAMVDALGSVTRMDTRIRNNYSRLSADARQLILAGYTAEQVTKTYKAGGPWSKDDWRARGNQAPLPSVILSTIGKYNTTSPGAAVSAADPAILTLERERMRAKVRAAQGGANESNQ